MEYDQRLLNRAAIPGLVLLVAGCILNEPPSEPPPIWSVGDHWNFRVEVEEREERASFTVVAERRDTYSVVWQWDQGRWDMEIEKTSLNVVFDVCGDPEADLLHGECKGRSVELDFPLWENKTWTAYGGGDAVWSYRAHAARNGSEWVLRYRDIDQPDCSECGYHLIYNSTIGFYRERLGHDFTWFSPGPARWTLVAWSREAAAASPG